MGMRMNLGLYYENKSSFLATFKILVINLLLKLFNNGEI